MHLACTSRKWMAALLLVPATAWAADIPARRFAENPLVTVDSSPSLGDNVNGPTILRVPDWVQRPLGRYYMYFAHHKGQHIRLAYADSLHGPWKIYEPGVMQVADSAFFRPQPDPDPQPPGVYTHIASPEVWVDEPGKKIVLWYHGLWTEGKRWPEDVAAARTFMRENGYGQYTQAAESTDGIHFTPLPAISRQSYLRVFQHDGQFYAISRLGQLLHSPDPRGEFELGPSPWRDSPYANRVRHVAILTHPDKIDVFFTAIRDAPESVLHTTIPLTGDWKDWKATTYDKVMAPETSYECPDLPVEPSAVGEIYGPAKQLRDPALYVEDGHMYLFYTICGEQGVAAAEVTLP